MLGTFNPGQATMNISPKLTCIEMTPYPLFTMIIYGCFLFTFRASPFDSRAAFYPDINSGLSRIKLNLANFPGIAQPKQGFIKFRISHQHPPLKTIGQCNITLQMKN